MCVFRSLGRSILGVTSRRASRHQCRLAQAPTSKHQAPKKSRKRNTKHQAPNTKESPSSKLRTAAPRFELGIWSLELFWCLELGVWYLALGGSLAFEAWDLEPFHPPLLASFRPL